MNLCNELWRDEAGAVLTAETVLVGSVVVLGSVVGLNAAATAVNEELTDMAQALRSLDQSYVVAGRSSCRAWTAGSYFIQKPVAESISELCGEGTSDPAGLRSKIDEERLQVQPLPMGDEAAPNELPPVTKKPEPVRKKKNKKNADEE